MTIGPRFTPDELRTRLGITYEFSAEQLEVIRAPDGEPLLVVAGAGSGKTELMALRVIWLITNAYVRPDDSPAMRAFPLGQASATSAVLDLAGELAEHLREVDDIATFTLGLTAAVEGASGARILRPVQDVLDRQRGRLALLPLVAA